jgi:hypothetical protein
MAVTFRNGTDGVAVGLEGVVLTTPTAAGPGAGKLDSHSHLFDVAWDEPNSAGWGGCPRRLGEGRCARQ